MKETDEGVNTDVCRYTYLPLPVDLRYFQHYDSKSAGIFQCSWVYFPTLSDLICHRANRAPLTT